MGGIRSLIDKMIGDWYFPEIKLTDVVEIIILAVIVYYLIKWVKKTKAWMLMKGILVLVVFILIAELLNMNTILWIVENSISVLAIAAIIVFQPELRRALEQLGQKRIVNLMLPFDRSFENGRFSQTTIDEIVKAAYEMAKVKTGALIVVEREIALSEYQKTGISMDCIVSSQVLINIFEHNTPLHDGAVIIKGDRVASATCYLPLSDNVSISKELGTRHRAAVGMSEVSDALVIIVSEETGIVSIAREGKLTRRVTPEHMREELLQIQDKNEESKRFTLKKGWSKDEKKTDK